MQDHPIPINHLDHVAIRVKDLDFSAQWYSRVLGLKHYNPEAWNGVPRFLLSGTSGIALFPIKKESHNTETNKAMVVDHFAFNTTAEGLQRAMHFFNSEGIPYQFQDHTYFHSVYIKDPDNHTVELTCIVVDPKTFY